MVFFTCSHCGESLKKGKVEKHYQTYCSRKPVAVTCVDCCKDFSAETYTAHTKCVSEEEKYSAKGFVPRPSTQKGEYKQKKWQDIIKSVHKTPSSLSGEERVIINAIVKRENVPRKKSKFQNFLRSCMKSNYSLQAADSIFDKLEALSKEEELKGKKDNQQEAESNGVLDGKNEIKENDSLTQKENDDSPTQETEAEEKLGKKERKDSRKKAKYEAELKELEGNEMKENDNSLIKKENDDSPTQETQTEENLSKKERKEKRKRAKYEAELKELEGNEMKENDDSLIQKENDDSATQETQAEEKLSKKERKERRKRGKYEAELKELQGNQVTQAENGGENEDEAGKKKISKRGLTAVSTENDTVEQERSRKKQKAGVIGAQNGISGDTEISEGDTLKKHKKEEILTKIGISEDNEVAKDRKSKKKQKKDGGVTDIGDAAISDGGISKKKRKKGQDGVEDKDGEEPTNKKSKRNDTEEMAEDDSPHTAGEKRKFNWQNIIIEVLKSKKSQELPLKRLQKKVLAEFEAAGGGSAADVKIIAKFNKKVHKTPGVVIRKEVAKLSSLDR